MEFLNISLSNYVDEQFKDYEQNWTHSFNFDGP
jgi:hypothetical protein